MLVAVLIKLFRGDVEVPRVIVVGGGWAGCASALSAAKAGAEVVLLERSDMLLGTGLVGGIFRNNGRFTAAEEAIAMGGGELFELMDSLARHRNIGFPGHEHASLYSVVKIEPEVRELLKNRGVKMLFRARVIDVNVHEGKITSVVLDDKTETKGDCFVDSTGSAGVPANCVRYGNGCAMCILRCHAFRPRISITEKAGVKEFVGKRADGSLGAMSGSCELIKDSLSAGIQNELSKRGVVVIPLPKELVQRDKLNKKACVQYAIKEFAENLVLLDTGPVKLMAPFFSLEDLRRVHGFGWARYEDPIAGGIGNSIRFMAMAPRDNIMKVKGVDNMFCAGEKAGPQVGHTEALCTGLLAGHNAVRNLLQMECLEMPQGTSIGDYIAFVKERTKTEEGIKHRYTFSGGLYFKRMKERSIYSTNIGEIRERIGRMGLIGIFSKKLM